MACLTKNLMEENNNLSEEQKLRAAERVLKSTGKEEIFDIDSITSVKIYFNTVSATCKEDAIIVLSFDPNDTIIDVYAMKDNDYEYLGEVGCFNNVDSISFLDTPLVGRYLITFREVRYDMGLFETNSQLRGFAYKDNEFKEVLNIDEYIEKYCSKVNTNGESLWQMLYQECDVLINNNEDLVIRATKYQTYSTANGIPNSYVKPDIRAFKEQDNRIEKELYIWSDEWQRFILGEKIEKETNERVAILKNYSNYPHTLTESEINQFKIERKDGTIDIVESDSLREISDDIDVREGINISSNQASVG